MNSSDLQVEVHQSLSEILRYRCCASAEILHFPVPTHWICQVSPDVSCCPQMIIKVKMKNNNKNENNNNNNNNNDPNNNENKLPENDNSNDSDHCTEFHIATCFPYGWAKLSCCPPSPTLSASPYPPLLLPHHHNHDTDNPNAMFDTLESLLVQSFPPLREERDQLLFEKLFVLSQRQQDGQEIGEQENDHQDNNSHDINSHIDALEGNDFSYGEVLEDDQ